MILAARLNPKVNFIGFTLPPVFEYKAPYRFGFNSGSIFKASSIDIYRKYWILSNGHICKFENDKFEEKFDCDRALDSLDVYDDENLIAWQEGGDLFAAVQKTQNSSGPKTENPKVKSGWYPNPDRTWSYYKDDVVVRSQWIHVEFIIIFIQL